MDFDSRISRLISFLRAVGGPIDNQKRLDKLAYLCQVSGSDLLQDFSFEFYEITSASLPSDLEKATSLGLLNQFKLTDSQDVQLTENRLVKSELNGERGYEIVPKFAALSDESLDLLSTLVYLLRLGYSEETAVGKIHQLKGADSKALEEAKSLSRMYFAKACKSEFAGSAR